jgi:hypothetical protein
MKLKFNMDRNISVGDILKVEFNLDYAYRSFIEKWIKVMIINELWAILPNCDQ